VVCHPIKECEGHVEGTCRGFPGSQPKVPKGLVVPIVSVGAGSVGSRAGFIRPCPDATGASFSIAVRP
jgi:hypothetical protein